MILKFYETNKINLNHNKIILLYGKNEGHKKETINILIKSKNIEISNFDEKDILENFDSFIESIGSRSLFKEEKIIIIKRSTEKSLNFIKEIENKNLEDVMIILNADNLDKKSKLRSFFEKDKKYVCLAFYPDNEETLSKLAYSFLREKNFTLTK